MDLSVNPQSFSSLIPSYLLKVTKSFGKISQFELLIMTEKNIFAYKLFLSLNISDFNLFFMWKLQPPWKKSPPLSQQPPSKSWGPVKPPPFRKFGWRLNPSPLQKGGGAHYAVVKFQIFFNLPTCSNYSITNNVKIPVFHFLKKGE